MAHRDFDAGRTRTSTKKKGPTFTLVGQEFRCLPGMPAGGLQRIAMAVRVNDRGEQVYDSPNVIRFLEDALVTRLWVEEPAPDDAPEGTAPGGHWEPADDRARFRALVDPPEAPEELIEIEELGEIMDWLLEEYQGRPTSRSAS